MSRTDYCRKVPEIIFPKSQHVRVQTGDKLKERLSKTASVSQNWTEGKLHSLFVVYVVVSAAGPTPPLTVWSNSPSLCHLSVLHI